MDRAPSFAGSTAERGARTPVTSSTTPMVRFLVPLGVLGGLRASFFWSKSFRREGRRSPSSDCAVPAFPFQSILAQIPMQGVGAINVSGQLPIILMKDGPSLGGFVCIATIAESEMWKLGQMQGGSKIKFVKIHNKDPVILQHRAESHTVTFRRSGESNVLVRQLLRFNIKGPSPRAVFVATCPQFRMPMPKLLSLADWCFAPWCMCGVAQTIRWTTATNGLTSTSAVGCAFSSPSSETTPGLSNSARGCSRCWSCMTVQGSLKMSSSP